MAAEGAVFVTVGTTKFEQLVHAVLDPDFLNVSRSLESIRSLLIFRCLASSDSLPAMPQEV